MRIWVYLLDVLTGRIAHWNSTDVVVGNEIWNRTESLSKPQREVLRSFLVASGIVIEALIGPGKASKNARALGLRCNLKNISIDQFRDLYDVLLTYFVVLHYRSDYVARRRLKSMDIHASHPLGHRLVEPLNKVVSNKGLSEELAHSLGLTGEVDMARLASQTWEQIVSILGCGDKTAGQLFYFGQMASSLFLKAKERLLL